MKPKPEIEIEAASLMLVHESESPRLDSIESKSGILVETHQHFLWTSIQQWVHQCQSLNPTVVVLVQKSQLLGLEIGQKMSSGRRG